MRSPFMKSSGSQTSTLMNKRYNNTVIVSPVNKKKNKDVVLYGVNDMPSILEESEEDLLHLQSDEEQQKLNNNKEEVYNYDNVN